jgi:hypothetical protein
MYKIKIGNIDVKCTINVQQIVIPKVDEPGGLPSEIPCHTRSLDEWMVDTYYVLPPPPNVCACVSY